MNRGLCHSDRPLELQRKQFWKKNETHKSFGNFELQTVPLISTKRADQVIINKNK